MKETTKQNLAFASALGAVVSIAFVAVITVVAELLPDLKNWLKELSGHHWVSKSILSMLVYGGGTLFVFWFHKSTSLLALKRALLLLIGAVLLGAATLLGFYTWHYFAA